MFILYLSQWRNVSAQKQQENRIAVLVEINWDVFKLIILQADKLWPIMAAIAADKKISFNR